MTLGQLCSVSLGPAQARLQGRRGARRPRAAWGPKLVGDWFLMFFVAFSVPKVIGLRVLNQVPLRVLSGRSQSRSREDARSQREGRVSRLRQQA